MHYPCPSLWDRLNSAQPVVHVWAGLTVAPSRTWPDSHFGVAEVSGLSDDLLEQHRHVICGGTRRTMRMGRDGGVPAVRLWAAHGG